MWCEILACGKHLGQEMTYTIFCLLVSTFPPQNIAYSLKSKSKLWIPIQLISKRIFPKFCPRISLTVKEWEFLLCKFHSKLQKEKSSNMIKRRSPWAKWPLEASSVSQEGHWLCFPALLRCWLGAAHRKHGSITRHAVEFSGADTLSQLYFLRLEICESMTTKHARLWRIDKLH